MSSVKMVWMGEEATNKFKEKLEVRLETSLKRIVTLTKAELPRQTGALAESVEYRINGLEGSWGSDIDYASDVEFGTRERAPDGTWRRVLNNNKNMIKETIKGNM